MWFHSRSPKTNRHVPRTRLALESLENRLAPATIVVTTRADVVDESDRKVSLREAITKANGTTEADTILLGAGVYEIVIPGAGEDGNAKGDFDINYRMTIKGKGARSTFIDGGNLDRVFSMDGNHHLQLYGMTIRNGFEPQLNGGGIYALECQLTLTNCIVSGNFALQGGGIYARHTGLTLNNSSVIGNVAGQSGGGIYSHSGVVTLSRSRVIDNRADATGGGIRTDGAKITLTKSLVSGNASGGSGGGIATAEDNVIMTNSTVRGNVAGTKGGGIHASEGSTTLTNCSVIGNVAAEDGGGIYASGVKLTLTNSTVRLNRAGEEGGGIRSGDRTSLNFCTISENTARSGGGIFMANFLELKSSTVHGNRALSIGGGLFLDSTIAVGESVLSNVTLSGNTAAGFGAGGGLFNNSRVTLRHVTVTRNAAVAGGGVFNNGTLSAFNTLIAQNQVTGGAAGGPDVSGTFESVGRNLIGIRDGSSGWESSRDLLGTAAAPLNARLRPLARNGGPTLTHALNTGSPAIDAGDNSFALATDQRGIHRPRDGDRNGIRIVDIGAFER